MTAPHQYTLAEIRNGTGFPRDARFVLAQPTDQDVVDAIATLLGTSARWTSDQLETIASIIGQVRPNPGDLYADGYAERFRDATGRDLSAQYNRGE